MVIAIATAIPTVKPTIIEFGTSLAYFPTPKIPITINTIPEIIETTTKNPCADSNVRPSGLYLVIKPAITGIKAAVGPYTWYFEPPNVLPITQANAPAIIPCSGLIPIAIAKPIAMGIAVIATISPALKSW